MPSWLDRCNLFFVTRVEGKRPDLFFFFFFCRKSNEIVGFNFSCLYLMV
jgi:hypothetical protein